MLYIIAGIASAVTTVGVFFTMLSLRRVVPTNEVHIVQSGGKTTSYGANSEAGNSYYDWPAWMPLVGITTSVLPVSVFKLELKSYDAYDVGRVPFEVDVVAFFRVSDSNLAAQRVGSFEDLVEQLLYIVRGAVRTILASHDIDKIMGERSTFGQAFTDEVSGQLKNWGVVTVKNIELMDIRDNGGNVVIHNIMQKKKSLIEMESRTEVAANMQKASVAEINAKQAVDIQEQVALEVVGLRAAQRDQSVGIAQQKADQAVKEESRATKEKEMAIIKVQQVKQAEINKETRVIEAEQAKEVTITQANAEQQSTVMRAEGEMQAQKRQAEGTVAIGNARAEAEKAMQLAPVQAQITLAKEIGENEGYQKYLITIRQVEASQVVGVEQAKALEKANVKIIANAGDPVGGMGSVMDLFNSKGGTNIGAMLEGLAQTDEGKALLAKLNGSGE